MTNRLIISSIPTPFEHNNIAGNSCSGVTLKILMALLTLSIMVSVQAQNIQSRAIHERNYYNPADLDIDTAKWAITTYGSYKFTPSKTFTKRPVVGVDYQATTNNQRSYYSVGYLYDNYSFFYLHTLSGSYSHEFVFGNNHRIRVGGCLLLVLSSIDYDKLYTISTPYETSHALRPYFDMDIGFLYRYNGWYAALSAKNIISMPYPNDSAQRIRLPRGYYGGLAYKFELNQCSLTPFAHFRYEYMYGIDLGLRSNLFHYLDLTYTLRVVELRHVITAVGHLPKGVIIGISLDQSHIHKDHNLALTLGFSY